jgi:hypothetical protein
MTKETEVLNYLLPQGGWTMLDNDFKTLVYEEGITPLTAKQLKDTLENIEAIKLAAQNVEITAKAALLDRLGITQDEAKLLLG